MNRLRLSLLLSFAFLVVTSATPLRAQIGIYGGFTGAPVSGTGVNWAYGGTVGIFSQGGHLANTVQIGGDLRGTFISRNGFHFYTGAAGPRIAFKAPAIPLRPYVEGLIGVASYNSGNGTDTTTHFNYQGVAGLDLTFFPHLDWRVIDFAYSGVAGQSVNAKNLTTGLVLRLW
jgi:hypothetical protein